jgi:hypothetical protein
MRQTIYKRLKGLLQEQHLKRTMVLVLVSVFGYYSMFNVSGAANQGSAVTGAPFNSSTTCTDCHGGSTNYGATVSLQLMSGSTVVTNYTPGQAYIVRITRSANATFNGLSAAGWGFQMACATGTGNTNSNTWGTMPTGVQNIALSGRNYVEHNTKLSKTTTTLDIPWTAPTSGTAGTANFYIALNSVNGNGSTSGDQVVTSSLSIPAVSCPTPSVSVAASSSTICSGTNVTFTATPTNGGTTPTYQWKNNGTAITGATNATYSSTTLANGNLITCVMTPAAPCNSSSATSNTITMVVNTVVTPSVSISASSSTICSGGSATFTATPINGGSAPTYQWKLNGSNIIGATGASYTSSSFSNGDVVSVVMTSSAACYTSQTATSNSVTMIVNQNLVPSVSIAASVNNICSGTPVTFTATPTNGGNAPIYQWKKNGSSITGATASTYTSSVLANNDVISVVMTTSAVCYTSQTAVSNNVTVVVNTSLTPSVVVAASNTNVCAGTSVTFTATPTNGGATPTYQWHKNNTAITGATNVTYATSTLANGDVVSVVMGSSISCASSSSASSNSVSMTVNPIVTPSVTASTTATTVCPGAAVTFTSSVTNGGTGTLYQWLLNGTNISGATGSSYTASSGVNNGSQYSVSVTSNANCLAINTASSNPVTMTLTSPVATITASGNTALCSGGNVTLTASNGASYLWSNGATAQAITVSTAGFYSVAVTSFGGCVSNSAVKQVQTFPTKNKVTAVGLTTVCEPLSISFKADPTIGNVGLFNFQWNNNGLPITGATDSIYTASGASTGTITLTLSGATCSSTSAIGKAFTIKAKPTAAFTPLGPATMSICSKASLTLTAPSLPGYTYKWLLDGTSKGGANPFLAKLSGVYTVIATLNACNDTSKFPITLIVNPLPVVTGITANPAIICAGTSSTLSATPANGAYYWWYIGTAAVDSSASANKIVSPVSSSSYKVMIKDSNGCYSKTGGSAKVTVTPLPAPVITPATATITSTGTVKLTAAPAAGVTFQWYTKVSNTLTPINGATAKSYIANSAGDYVVALTKLGCTGYSSPAVISPTGIRSETGATSDSGLGFELSAYPNPVSEQLNVSVSGMEIVNGTLTIMDINGRLVLSTGMNSFNTTVDMTNLTTGVYFIRYKDSDGRTATLKVTKE